MRKLLHFAGMQGAWFAAALLADGPWHLLGALANASFLAVHVALSGQVARELERAGRALAVGLVVELVNARVGHVVAQQAGTWPPLWLLWLWPAFATSFMEGHTLAWLRGRWGTAALLGAVLGPVGYFGGARLGALELDGVRSALCLAATWACAMPLLAWEPVRPPRAG